jgi:hypothetical protein
MSEAEKRSARRQRMLKDGKIITKNERSVIDCSIRDISDTGAKIRCGDQVAVPKEFQLFLPQSRFFREARTVWRRGNEIGIVFTGDVLTPPAWTAKLLGGRA